MPKSIFTNLSVEDREQSQTSRGMSEKPPPAPSQTGFSKSSTDKVRVTFEFCSADQASTVSKILTYQVEKLNEQAEKNDKNGLSYIADMLREQASVVSSMVIQIKRNT